MANRSTFPNQIDTFIEHVDISPFDIANVQRYQELKLKSNKTSAEIEELNNLTVLLRDKILTPEDFNKLQDAMVNIETFTKDTLTNYYKYMGEYNSTTAYKTFNSVMYNGDIYLALYDVQGILPTDTSKWLKISQKGDKGDKAFNWKGTYDNNTSYVVDDVVYYNGSSYVCIRNSTGHLPIDVAYWSPCALKGTDGVGFKFKGIWNSGYAYNLDDAVSYNNKIYYCIQGNIGQLPTNTDYWQEFLAQQTEAIQISINDVDGYYNATNVEDALKEIWEKNRRTYTAIQQLGINYDNCTMENIIEAMEDNSTLITDVTPSWTAFESPSSSKIGTLRIYRINSVRVTCMFDYSALSFSGNWVGQYRSDQTPKFSGWYRVYSEGYKPTPDSIGAVNKSNEGTDYCGIDPNNAGKIKPERASANWIFFSTNLTLALPHAGCVLSSNTSSAVTVTIPTNASVPFPLGTEIEIERHAGAVTISAQSGVSIRCSTAARTIAGQYKSVCLKKIATDTWLLQGDLV